MALLDTPTSRLYRVAPLALGLVVLSAQEGRAEVVNGVQLPNGVKEVGENRYRTNEDFEATLKYFRTVYPPAQYPRKAIVNQPGVKAVHISNPSKKHFEGINIYEAEQEVRIFIIPAKAPPKAPAKKKAGEPKPAKK